MASSPRLVAVGIGAALVVTGAWFAQARGGADATVRTYYIAAEEVDWDYLPGGDLVSGRPVDSLLNAMKAPGFIGHVYRKAVYREYTDSTFSQLKPHAPGWEHLGILGPLIRAEVGDTIRVVFTNRASRAYSMHPHGVIYDKDSEGAPYQDGTADADKADDAVAPGATHTYVWPVPERAGPSDGESSSSIWMYHSHVNESKDVNAGLMGPLIVTARGRARADGSPVDVDREVVTMFAEFDENESWYADENVTRFVSDASKVDRTISFTNPFFLSNLMETVNGLSYGNTRIQLERGQRVRWYVFASTNFGDLHAPHWHGNVVVANHMRTDVLGLVAMGMHVADMVPDNDGTWMFHCHVREHNDFGMQALFSVGAGPVVAASGHGGH
jgi:FtsP/CotA-like multicopper oxidase with cupredoxin domain